MLYLILQIFFSDPLIIKNPYNNIPFNKSTLYNIYLNIRSKTQIVTELIHKFFLSNFDLNKFEKDYEYLIRENAIQKYVKNSDINTLYNSSLIMIDNYNDDIYYDDKNKKININLNFPKKQLVDIMRPYLLLYFTSKYSLIGIKKMNAKNILNNKLKEFQSFNSFV